MLEVITARNELKDKYIRTTNVYRPTALLDFVVDCLKNRWK